MFDAFFQFDSALDWLKYGACVLSLVAGIGIAYWLKDKIYEFLAGILVLGLLISPAGLIARDSPTEIWVLIVVEVFFGFLGFLFVYPIFSMRKIKTKIDGIEKVVNSQSD
jgi:hypothetical protein